MSPQPGQPIDAADLTNRFSYHPPTGPEDVAAYQVIRAAGLAFAKVLVANCPASRETSLAVTHVEDAVMWANAAKARHGASK
jgi:hypothetical protein